MVPPSSSSKPPARPSKRPSKAPVAAEKRSKPPPKRAQTMEVQMAWLDSLDAIEAVIAPANEDDTSQTTKRRNKTGANRRHTTEVQLAWLEPDSSEETPKLRSEPPPSSRKKPPRLPGASRTLPPMPVISPKTQRPPPQRHNTMEVEMQWVEIVDETKPEKRTSKRPAARISERPKKQASVAELLAACQASTEDPDASAIPERSSRRSERPSKQPAPKARKPIPRED